MGYTFSGHETFTVRNYWLKKGLDHIWAGGKFDNYAIRELGVGKNMVSAIKYWTKAFGLHDFSKDNSDLAKYLFNDISGKDPYLEDVGTIWLLHYLLVTTEVASTYYLVFNYFRKLRIEFTKEHLLAYIENECNDNNSRFNANSVKKDISVFLNNYITPESGKSIESDFMGLLYELKLVNRVRKEGAIHTYKIDNKSRENLSYHILLASILLQGGENSITFSQLLTGVNSVGSVYCLNSKALMDLIEEMCNAYPDHLVYKDDGGVQVLQIRGELNFTNVLNDYYV